MVKNLINARVWIPLGLLPLLGMLWALRLPAVAAGSQSGSHRLASRRPPAPSHIRRTAQCPSQLEALMPLLLRDLPSYANRVSQRAYPDRFRATAADPAVIPGYLLLAGNPDYRPLSLAGGEYRSPSETEVPQVFFTTLERQYFSDQAFELQHYHWLFLTPTQTGWQLVLMLSSIGNQRKGAQADEPPSPPRDSSQGVIAQAIRLWLRDCEAGSIAAPSELPSELPEIPQQISPAAPRTDRQS
ncbi:MAG: hypothetical protein KME07_24005 [Pegethrix bostrychoides GSE-TBD4-15B]|uniref:Uncharacterized protein n=1 Tax=Pegethrix bostrychoides GSE-TBD4-15B TaxID=2839662 RepID=A0A951PF47_9CYAN|nr:hypothetical protein [Pegethrix bostrychoides GSE-TBD4-15B]